MKRLFLLPLLFGLIFHANSQQTQIDSLKKLLGSHDSTEVKVLRKLARTYSLRSNDSGLYYNKQALDLATELGLMNQRLEIMNGRSELLFRSGNYTQALQVSLDYLQLAESLKDTTHIFNSNRNIMMTYEYLPNGSGKIMHYANKLLELVHSGYFKDPGEREKLELIGYVNHALAYYKSTGQKDSILYFSQRSYEMAVHLNDDQMLALAAGNMAMINYQLGNDELAISYYRAGVLSAQRSERYDALTGFEIALAELYQKTGHKDSSRHYIRRSLATLEKVVDPNAKMGTYTTLSDIFKNDHQFDSAYKYLSLGVQLKDSLYSEQKLTAVETMMSIEQLRQLEIQQKQLKEKEERKLNLQFVVIALGLIAFAILFLVFSYSIIANQRLIQFLGIVGLLVLFELINLFVHPYLENYTNHSPFFMLLIMVLIAAMLVPAHHYLQKWVSNKLVEKNKKIRLAAARKTIAKLEGEKLEH